MNVKAILSQYKNSIPLNEITISSTTNGKHSTNSNNKRHEAVDISRIDGIRIKNYKISKRYSKK